MLNYSDAVEILRLSLAICKELNQKFEMNLNCNLTPHSKQDVQSVNVFSRLMNTFKGLFSLWKKKTASKRDKLLRPHNDLM